MNTREQGDLRIYETTRSSTPAVVEKRLRSGDSLRREERMMAEDSRKGKKHGGNKEIYITFQMRKAFATRDQFENYRRERGALTRIVVQHPEA